MTKSNRSADEDLIARMDRIRNASEFHVEAMHHEAERLVDWREHVRSKPLLSFAAAALVGYSLVKRQSTTPPARTLSLESSREERDDAATMRTSAASGAMAFLGSMASSMLRNYVSGYVRNQLRGFQHDRSNPPRQEPNSTFSR